MKDHIFTKLFPFFFQSSLVIVTKASKESSCIKHPLLEGKNLFVFR